MYNACVYNRFMAMDVFYDDSSAQSKPEKKNSPKTTTRTHKTDSQTRTLTNKHTVVSRAVVLQRTNEVGTNQRVRHGQAVIS